MSDARRFIRHPADVPIEVQAGSAGATGGTAHNVSLGGLAIAVDCCLDPGAIVDVRIPGMRPAFETRGRVAWCREGDDGYEMGVQFLDASDAFRARMVEQVCHIEQYRRDVSEREGREMSGQEAAREWIRRFAADFPDPREAASG